MTSTKGWLLPRGPNEPPRLTAGQANMVAAAIGAILDQTHRQVGDATIESDAIALSRKVLLLACRTYPADRSCHTCDFLHGVHCKSWDTEVPAVAMEAGCDNHQTDGAPF